MKEKTAEIIRIITIPPIEAMVMLLILYGLKREEFGTTGNLLLAVLFLTVIPICSYPIASRKKNKEDARNAQIRASGHACSCTLPYLILSYYFGRGAAIICLILYLAEGWASVELKRHTIKEFLGGTIVACLIFAVILISAI